MFKHANTFFPGDTVTRTAHGQKLAGQESRGKVIGAEPDSGKVKVAFDDGTESFVSPEELSKE